MGLIKASPATEPKSTTNFLDAEIIPELDLARSLNVSLRTLRRLAANRQGPPRVKIARKVFYRAESVRRWIAAQEQSPLKLRGSARRR